MFSPNFIPKRNANGITEMIWGKDDVGCLRSPDCRFLRAIEMFLITECFGIRPRLEVVPLNDRERLLEDIRVCVCAKVRYVPQRRHNNAYCDSVHRPLIPV